MNYKKRSDRQRLAIDIPIDVHKELKEISANRHCTITKYVLRLIVKELLIERKYNTKE